MQLVHLSSEGNAGPCKRWHAPVHGVEIRLAAV